VILIRVAQSRCEPEVPTVSCNEAQRVVARSTARPFATRYGLNPRTLQDWEQRAVPSSTAPHVPPCSSSSASHGPSSGRWRRRP